MTNPPRLLCFDGNVKDAGRTRIIASDKWEMLCRDFRTSIERHKPQPRKPELPEDDE